MMRTCAEACLQCKWNCVLAEEESPCEAVLVWRRCAPRGVAGTAAGLGAMCCALVAHLRCFLHPCSTRALPIGHQPGRGERAESVIGRARRASRRCARNWAAVEASRRLRQPQNSAPLPPAAAAAATANRPTDRRPWRAARPCRGHATARRACCVCRPTRSCRRWSCTQRARCCWRATCAESCSSSPPLTARCWRWVLGSGAGTSWVAPVQLLVCCA